MDRFIRCIKSRSLNGGKLYPATSCFIFLVFFFYPLASHKMSLLVKNSELQLPQFESSVFKDV